MECLFLDDITVRFGHTNALDKVMMTLPDRGVLALVGPNGAGKSTLLDVLSGFIQPSDGCVRLAQQSPKMATEDLRRRFARLHQRLVVPPALLVREYLYLAAQPELATSIRGLVDRSWCKTETVEDVLPTWLKDLLSSGGLWQSLNARLDNLSYGQQRIVALGAVLPTS
jgi:ABC-type branched-subunit amino acid transport system ATPase component